MHLMEQGQLDLSDGNRKPGSTEVQWNTPEVFTIVTGFRLIHILALNLKHGPDSNKKNIQIRDRLDDANAHGVLFYWRRRVVLSYHFRRLNRYAAEWNKEVSIICRILSIALK